MKKAISFIITICLLTSVVAPSVVATADEAVVYELGDVDGSKVIDPTDALIILKNAAQLTTLSQEQLAAADVDKSGVVNAQDALYVLQYAAKVIVRFVFTPEENFQILKDYIVENGVVDENGIYVISRDYVAENDSEDNVEIDSFSYDAENDLLVYKYDVDYTVENDRYTYSQIIELGESESTIRLIYDEDSTEMLMSVDVSEKINNSQLKITKIFNLGLNKDKYIINLKDLDITDKDIEKFEKNNMKYINAMMHSAVLSMEDYLKSTLVMNLKDLGFSSYTYTDEQFDKVFAPLYGIDFEILESFQVVKSIIYQYGVREDEEIIFSTGTTGGYSASGVDSFNSDTYLIYNETEDVIYFSGMVYTYPSNHAISVLIQPFIDGCSYCNAVLYEPGLESYEHVYNVDFYTHSNKFKYGTTYDYEYIEPVNGEMTYLESDITSFAIARVLEDVAYELWSKGDDYELINKLGFSNIH